MTMTLKLSQLSPLLPTVLVGQIGYKSTLIAEAAILTYPPKHGPINAAEAKRLFDIDNIMITIEAILCNCYVSKKII